MTPAALLAADDAAPDADTRLLHRLREELLAADAVSFDVLDTLFLRMTARPEDVFDLVGARHRLFGYRRVREEAQRRAFQVMHAQGRHEIDLHGVCACLPPLPVPAAVLEADEEALELAVLRPNPEMVEVLRFAREQGRRVVVMSDMYLPRPFFEDLLARWGLEVDGVFVSSACQATKRDHGALFDHVAGELGVAPGRILHIGDNPHSDVARARERGFRAFHYAPDLPAPPPEGAPLGERVVSGLARVAAYEPDRSPWWRLGFAHAGPAALGWGDWLLERARQDRLDLVLNVSRDGWTLHRLWPDDAPAPSVYFRTSRTALFLSTLSDATYEAALPTLLSGAHGLTAAEVFARIGVEGPDDALLADLGLDPAATFSDDTHPAFAGLLRLWRPRVLRVCGETRRGLHAYLREAGLRDGMRVGFVDVGWSGTTQDAFLRATEPFVDLDVHGYYLCLRDDAPTRERRGRLHMQAMVSAQSHGAELVERIYANRVAVELMLSAPHPSVIGYSLGRGGEVGFVEDPGRGADPRLAEVAREIDAGAVEAATRLRVLRAELGGGLPGPDDLLAPLLDLALHPTRAQAGLMGPLHNFDAWGSGAGFRSAMAAPPNPGETLRGDAWPAGLVALGAG